ncbi:hypothetical protein BC829DRAFT_408065, partial [Chytridium lagenaria]
MLYLLALDGFTHEPWAHGNLFVHLSDAIRNTPITGDPIGCLKVLMKDERFNPAMNGCEAVMHAVWSGSGSMVKLLIKDERVCALVTPKMREILFGQIGMDDKKRGFEVIEALMGDKEWCRRDCGWMGRTRRKCQVRMRMTMMRMTVMSILLTQRVWETWMIILIHRFSRLGCRFGCRECRGCLPMSRILMMTIVCMG